MGRVVTAIHNATRVVSYMPRYIQLLPAVWLVLRLNMPVSHTHAVVTRLLPLWRVDNTHVQTCDTWRPSSARPIHAITPALARTPTQAHQCPQHVLRCSHQCPPCPATHIGGLTCNLPYLCVTHTHMPVLHMSPRPPTRQSPSPTDIAHRTPPHSAPGSPQAPHKAKETGASAEHSLLQQGSGIPTAAQPRSVSAGPGSRSKAARPGAGSPAASATAAVGWGQSQPDPGIWEPSSPSQETTQASGLHPAPCTRSLWSSTCQCSSSSCWCSASS